MKAAVTDVLRSRCLHRRRLFLPDEQHDAADRLMSEIRSTVGLVPALFWFETRNLFLVAERRGRLRPGEPILLMTQLRRLPLEDAGSGGDGLVLLG